MKQKESEKGPADPCVFAIINIADTKEQRKNNLRYAADYAVSKNLPLVIHPRYDNSGRSFKSAYKSISTMAMRMKISYTMSRKVPGFFGSICDVAVQYNAVRIVMGIGNEKKKGLRNIFGENMWDIANKTAIPLILVPQDTQFDNFSEVTIAIDSTRKIQKTNFLNAMKTENMLVHLFIEKTESKIKQDAIDATLRQIKTALFKNDISYKEEVARNEENYSTHLLRFAAKRSKLLLIEIDEDGSLGSDLRKNLRRILFSKHQHFAVMLVKTNDVTITRWSY